MKDKTPPKITPVPNCGEMKMKPAKPPVTIITAIVHKIRRCEIGGAADGSIWILSESSLIAKHKFYKGIGQKAKGRKEEIIESESKGIGFLYFHFSPLNICEVILKSCIKPITAPKTIPPTIPQGELPRSKSANQPIINIKITAPKSVIAAA